MNVTVRRMATRTVRMVVCDVCGTEGTTKYRLTRMGEDQRSIAVDLCAEHGQPVEDIMGTRPVARRKKRTVAPRATVQKRKPKKT